MKAQFLVFINVQNPSDGYRVADSKEWNLILKENRNLSRDQRRYFTEECIWENGEKDIIYVEATKPKYDKWHTQAVLAQRKRDKMKSVKVLSGSVTIDEENSTLFDVIENPNDMEEQVMSGMILEAFRATAVEWHDWAEDFIDLYINGMRKEAVKILSSRYGISEQMMRRRKRDFEAFAINYFEKIAKKS